MVSIEQFTKQEINQNRALYTPYMKKIDLETHTFTLLSQLSRRIANFDRTNLRLKKAFTELGKRAGGSGSSDTCLNLGLFADCQADNKEGVMRDSYLQKYGEDFDAFWSLKPIHSLARDILLNSMHT
jgi:hypothetical protein